MFTVPGPLDFWLFGGSVMVKTTILSKEIFILIFLCVNNENGRVNVGEVGGKIQRKSCPELAVCHLLLALSLEVPLVHWKWRLGGPCSSFLSFLPPLSLLQLFLDLDAINSPFLFLTELACAPYPLVKQFLKTANLQWNCSSSLPPPTPMPGST